LICGELFEFWYIKTDFRVINLRKAKIHKAFKRAPGLALHLQAETRREVRVGIARSSLGS
jgi:hypothetical protein